MRIKDENKKITICNVAIELITKNGFAGVSMSMIAEAAAISSSTIYVYFKNKEDMLNKLFLWVKEDSINYLLKGFDEDMSIREGIELFWNNAYHYAIAEPIKFSFSEQFANSPHINRVSRTEGKKYYIQLFNLLNKGVSNGIIKNIPLELLSAYIFAPITHLAKQQLSGEISFTEEMLLDAFKLTWDAIKV